MSDQEVLAKVLDALKTKVSSFNYNNWFSSSQWTYQPGHRVDVKVPNKFIRDWILDNYLEVIKFECYKITGAEHDIIFQVDPELDKNQPNFPIESPGEIKIEEKVSSKAYTAGLNLRYNFDSFVVGNSNQFVNAACKAVANNPAMNYNPLYIYGGVGLGKTHLLNAIGLHIARAKPDWKILMVTGEQFTNEVINSIRYDKTYYLRKKYRTDCDLLLIDDIQFIAGKERTMEEFFHTFNALYENRKQIILTSDTLPKDIPNLEERLRSRFGWGLLADIQAPDYETRVAILKKKAEDDKISISAEICEFIASNVTSNVRDLEGSLVRVSAFASLAGVPISINLAKEVLKNIFSDYQPRLTIEGIQSAVAGFYHLHTSDLKSQKRHKNIAVPRQIAMYLCKKHIKASFPEIGLKFGGKDHTTVMHAVKRVKSIASSDQSFKDSIDQIEQGFAQH